MDSTAWLAIATFGAAIVGLVGGIIGTRRQRREIRELHSKMGNGFATEVLEQLGAIAGNVDAVKVQVAVVKKRVDTHIAQHADGVFASKKR